MKIIKPICFTNIVVLLFISIFGLAHANSDDNVIIRGYHMEWNKIDGDVMYFDDLIVEQIDAKTFKNPSSVNMDYGHDKSNVYYQGEHALNNLEPNTYEIGMINAGVYNDYISYDEDTFCIKDECIQVNGPVDVEFLEDGLLRFGKELYRYSEYVGFELIADNSDPENFATGYNIVDEAVYWYGNKIEEAEPESFELIGASYAKDKNNVYHEGMVIYGKDASSFEVYDVKREGKPTLVVKMDKYKADEIKKEYPRESKRINSTIKTLILEYKEKYPGYRPQPAIDPDNPPKHPTLDRLWDIITDYKYLNPPVYYLIIYSPVLLVLVVVGFVFWRRKRK